MTNEELEIKVTDELFWDPKVNNESIVVSADDGTVTLRGAVGSLREKREAAKATQRIYGVVDVKNKLKVELMTENAREDADLRADVLRALMLDSLVPKTVGADVYGGYVTLTGTADRQFQRTEAEFIAGNIIGVIDVDDQIELTGPPPSAGQVDGAIAAAFDRNAKLDADALKVETSNGTVTVKGTVRSWAEHDEAIDAAWAAPGVRDVHDRILVLY